MLEHSLVYGPGTGLYCIEVLHGRLTGIRTVLLSFTEFSTCFTELGPCLVPVSLNLGPVLLNNDLRIDLPTTHRPYALGIPNVPSFKE